MARVGAVAVLACSLGAALPAPAQAAGATPTVSAATAATGASCSTAGSDLPVRVQLISISPAGALRPGTRLVIKGRVLNTGTRPITDLAVELAHRSARLSSRDEVRAWLDGSDGSADTQVGTPQVAAQLAAGRSATFSFDLTASQLGVVGTRFGPRGLSLQVRSGRAIVGRYRTSVIWMPAETFEPTPLALIAPITASGPSLQAGSPDDALLDQLGGSGRLTRLLTGTAGQPIGWALDPALLLAAATTAGQSESGGTTGATAPTGTTSTIAPTGTTSTTTGSGGGTTGPTAEQRAAASTWLGTLRRNGSGRETWLLPYADPDIAATAHAGAVGLLRIAQARGRAAAAEAIGATPDGTLGWPVEGRTDPAALGLLASTGHRTVLLDSVAAPPAEPNGNTLSAAAPLPGGGLRGLLYDQPLSAVFAGTGGTDPAGCGQQLLAELAAVTLERPYDPRPQLLAAPRGWDPQPAGVQAAMNALAAAPWVRLTRVSTVGTAGAGDLARVLAPYPASARAAELGRDQVRALAGVDNRLDRFGSALVDPVEVIGPRRDRVLSLLAGTWRSRRAEHAAATVELVQDAARLSDGPVVIEGGPFNLLTGSGQLPLNVRNPHPFAMKLELTLRPRSGRLVSDQRISLQLPADATRRVLVKVRSVADGTVTVDSLLSSPTGVLVSAPTTLVVRIHRNWETRGIGLLATGLTLVFLIGLVRSVRRGRTRVRPQDVPDLDELELYGPAEPAGSRRPVEPLPGASAGGSKR